MDVVVFGAGLNATRSINFLKQKFNILVHWLSTVSLSQEINRRREICNAQSFVQFSAQITINEIFDT